MSQSDQLKFHKLCNAFNQAIDHGIQECSRETGRTDLSTVYGYLRRTASMLIKRIIVLRGNLLIRMLIQKRLKHCKVSPKDAENDAIRNALQPEFDFFNMEQFRGVSKRITYREGNAIVYVEYNRSRKSQRVASVRHLDTGIAADIARRNAEMAADEFLDPLVEKYGDLPAQELVEKWLRDQRAAGGS